MKFARSNTRDDALNKRCRPNPVAVRGTCLLPRVEEVSDWDMMCAIRAVLARDGPLSRDALIRNVAHELGFARTGTYIASALDDAIRCALRRGGAQNRASELSLVARNVEG